MQHVIPPLCFLLAMAMLIMGFLLLAIGFPEATVELHRARASGDDEFTEVLEADLRRQQLERATLIAFSLGGSLFLTIVGFRAMRRH